MKNMIIKLRLSMMMMNRNFIKESTWMLTLKNFQIMLSISISKIKNKHLGNIYKMSKFKIVMNSREFYQVILRDKDLKLIIQQSKWMNKKKREINVWKRWRNISRESNKKRGDSTILMILIMKFNQINQNKRYRQSMSLTNRI